MVQSQESGSGARMRIGEFAEAAGVSVDAVRFYERRGVLPTAPRTPGGYRTFGVTDLERVVFARQLQQLGLTIAEIVDALGKHAGDARSCASERWRLEKVETRIEAQLAELQRARDQIRATLTACDEGRCPLARPADV